VCIHNAPEAAMKPARSGETLAKEAANEAEFSLVAQNSKAPTLEQRKLVRSMAAAGITSEAICLVIGVSGKTLRKHYRNELDTSAIRANAVVAGSLYRKAVNGNVVAQIFWLKTRGGWKEPERIQVQHSGAIGHYDLTKLSTDEIKEIVAKLEPASLAGSAQG
jgi:hypothetical protein